MDLNNKQKLVEMYASLGKLITSSLDIEAVLHGIMEEIHLFFDPENWSLLRYDETRDELFFQIAQGLNIDQIRDLRIKGGEGIAGRALEEHIGIFIPDISVGPPYFRKVDERTGFKTRSIIAVPIRFKDRIYGVIEIVNSEKGKIFSEEELLVLHTIADFAAIAFSNVEMYERTLHLAQHDPLTGALNRSSLNEFFQEIEESDDPIIVVSIDLDKFKEINDTLGHLAGDRALAYFGHSLKAKLESGTKLFRIGGDEFLIARVLGQAEEMETISNRIHDALKELREEGASRSPAIEFSWGANTGIGRNVRRILYESDLLMYTHKKNSDSHQKG